MGLTLLASTPDASWRGWLRENLGRRSLVVLDPAWAETGPAARVQVVREEKTVAWRFVGSLDAQKNPLGVASALPALLKEAGDSPVVMLFPLKWSPVVVQLALACAQIAQPDEVLAPAGSGFDRLPWPVGAEPVECEKPFPAVVRDTQRRAHWIELNDRSERHEIDWTTCGMQGTRLGSGRPVQPSRAGLWAEAQGSTLLVTAPRDLPEADAAALMNDAGAERLLSLSPDVFRGLLCSLAHQDGADFALGFIEEVDVERRKIIVKSPAPAPAPARIFKAGLLRIDANGHEVEELKPWSV